MAEKSFFRARVAVFRAFILTFAVKKILLDMILIADSGSTKTDWWLADGGHVVRRAASQGINPFHQDGGVIYGIVGGELLPSRGPCSSMAAGAALRWPLWWLRPSAGLSRMPRP